MADGFALVNAEVWTLKALKDRAQAIVVSEGKIEFVGREDRALQRARRLGLDAFDVGGARVLPGLIDGHTHLVHQGILPDRVDLWPTTSVGQALKKVAAAARKARPGELILAERFDESRWSEKRFPTAEELDAISVRHPVIMRRIDGHVSVANRVAAEEVSLHLRGVDKVRGLLVEEASLELHRVYPTPVPTAIEACRRAQDTALKLGITTVHEFVHPNYLRGWQALARQGELALQIVATPYVHNLESLTDTGFESGFGDSDLRLGGVKVFADGTIGGHTAALTKGYGDDPANLGRLNWTDEKLQSVFDQAQDGNLQISVHAIGDAAIDQCLRAMELLPKKDRMRLRHRIEHFEMATEEQWVKAGELGVVTSMQPNFVGAWGARGGMYENRFGDQRYKQTNLFRKMVDAGVQPAFGSDCMPLDPWFGLESTVRAPWPGQRLKVEEAIRCYSRQAAYGLGLEKDRGTLEKGKRADLIVVDGAWRDKGGIVGTKVLATSVGGRIVHRQRKFRQVH